MPAAENITAVRQLDCRLVVAVCRENLGIGYNGTLPWPHLRDDLRHFRRVTLNAAVLMGSKTYFSLPSKSRPLANRINVVLSSQSRQQLEIPDSVLLVGSLDAAEKLLIGKGVEVLYIIGGGVVFDEVLKHSKWSSRIYYTEIDGCFKSDCFFPFDMEKQDSKFSLISVSDDITENGVTYRFKEYIRFRSPSFQPRLQTKQTHEEYQYLNLIRHILDNGVSRGDRTGTGTRSVFGAQFRFNLRNSFPLLTTKKVFWRGVAEELFWFIRGHTNGNLLSEKRIKIWEPNGSREFLDGRGLHENEVGDLGPIYGFQWRHFGAKYTNMHADYSGQGEDQLANVIETIKNNPNDRRLLVSAWNPGDLKDMALPPCHLLFQFYVANGELSCQMYQRSCDMGLGVPFNIASYSLLTCLIADLTGLKRGDFVHVLGDAHVYNNHVEALTEQITREPRPFPKLIINSRERIEDYCLDDLILEGYDPHQTVSMKMAV